MSPAEAIGRLRAAAFRHAKEKHPGMPDHALVVRRYADTTANGLTRCVIDWLRCGGHQAERISNTGRPIDRCKTFTDVVGRARTVGSMEWIPGTGTRGSADISATIKGRSVKIEIKIKDRQSEHQKIYQQQVEAAGGVYIIVRSFRSFLEWYDKYLTT